MRGKKKRKCPLRMVLKRTHRRVTTTLKTKVRK